MQPSAGAAVLRQRGTGNAQRNEASSGIRRRAVPCVGSACAECACSRQMRAWTSSSRDTSSLIVFGVVRGTCIEGVVGTVPLLLTIALRSRTDRIVLLAPVKDADTQGTR